MGLPPRRWTLDEDAGAREPYEDAALYDYEYRHRRGDVTFYRRLAADRMRFPESGPVLDLACGTGRLLLPLLRDGHTVVGLDRSPAMLARAARRVARLGPTRRARALLLRSDLRAFAFRRPFALAICAFHSLQHLVTATELRRFFAAVRHSLGSRGWLAFDVLPPDPTWIGRDPERRWARTSLRHPESRQRFVYTTNHTYDSRRRVLHARLYYQPVDAEGRARGREKLVRLCHRQLDPKEVEDLLERAGFSLIASFASFDGSPLPDGGLPADEHVYVARVR